MRKKTESAVISKRNDIPNLLCILFSLLAAYFVVWAFTGMWPWTANPYNSYSLQAARWLSGHLDLGQNYSHLEIAEYGGKFFVSFPPFPSYVMLPFSLLFGSNTPDGWIALAVSFAGAVYTYKLAMQFLKSENHAVFWTLFLTIGSNMLFVTVNGWVWFIAQNMCFTLTMIAIYYAVKGKGGISLAAWACAVGCRPFQIAYIPVLLYLLYQVQKQQGLTLSVMIKKHIKWIIAPCLIAISYMILNYARFGSITEFGHNYLPEFVEAQNGQFHLNYIKQNFPLLFQLPGMNEKGILEFPKFNGMAFYLVSPIFISYIIYGGYAWFKGKKTDKFLAAAIPCLIAIELIFITAHKTMGGFHFGNRYTNDTLPFAFLGLLLLIPEDSKLQKLSYPLFLLGFALNMAGTIAVYNNWI